MPDRETSALDPDVEAWLDAFVAANGRKPDALPQYERGWFVWRHRFGNWITARHRRADLREMTKQLQGRANHDQ
jgi:hypothetical protein